MIELLYKKDTKFDRKITNNYKKNGKMYITDQLSTHGHLHHFRIKYPLKNTLLLDREFLCNSHLLFIYSLQFVSRAFPLNILCIFAYVYPIQL